jgi:hypothetical protein
MNILPFCKGDTMTCSNTAEGFQKPIAALQQLATVLCLAFLVSGCASLDLFGDSTASVDEIQPSGFLEDYSILRAGGEDEAALIYRNPAADFSRYEAVFIEPVTVWLGDNSALNDVDPIERQKLADEFYAEIVKTLQDDYVITAQPGPGTMRIRVALTDAQASRPVLDVVSTYVPQARLLASVATLGSDTAAFVGQASAEAEVRDAETGVLLIAGVDRRAGTKALGDSSFDAWEDVRRAFRAWTTQFANNLRRQRLAN